MSRLRTLFFFCVMTAGLVAAFVGGYVVRARQTVPSAPFSLLNEAYQNLRTYGLYDLPEGKTLAYGAIRGMVQAYADPYTVFVEPPQSELQNDALSGQFGGIGVTLEQTLDGQVILHPLPDSPALEAGIRDGDILQQVDALKVTPAVSLDQIQAALRGPTTQAVQMQVARPPAWEQFSFTVRRAWFEIPSVTWYVDADEARLGIVAVNRMAATTADEIRQAVEALSVQGATRFVLDLRDNGGGLLDAGVQSARLFLSSGVILQQQYRGKPVESVAVEAPGPLVSLPLVVLVNHGTASAAELLAGALQAQGRAPLIGEPTYGKDTLQLLLTLSDGSSMHVTAARWWVPGLPKPIGEGGLQPDFPVDATLPKAFLHAAGRYFFGQP
ncbi:MAG: S41 family peptidase [Anaerolineales bacterium]